MKQQTRFKQTEIGDIPDDWKSVKLGDCVEIIKKQYNLSNKVPKKYIGLEHIEQQNLRLNSIGSSEDIESNKFEFKSGQILFGKLRPYFRKLFMPNFDGICSTDIWVMNSKEGFDNHFMFYFLADERVIEDASRSSEGTRMPRARWDYLSKLEFPFPKLSEQQAIAKILSDLDTKIELNQRINKTIEYMGQSLFKHWFIDFEFPNQKGKPYKSSGGELIDSKLGEIPKGWNLSKIGNLVILNKESIKPFEKPEEFFYHYSIPAFDSDCFPQVDKGSTILSNKFRVKSNAILLSKLNPLTPRIWAIDEIDESHAVCSTEFQVMIPKNKMYYSYIYYLFISDYIKELIGSRVTGTSNSHQRIKPEDILSIEIVLPSKDILLEFEEVIRKSIILKDKNLLQNKSLSNIRDSLLPLLMSGKIKVPLKNG